MNNYFSKKALVFVISAAVIFSCGISLGAETNTPSADDGRGAPDRTGAAVIHEGTEWQAHASNQKERFIKMVTVKKEWDDLWKRAFDKPAPAVDFDKYEVACVFLGNRADWLYNIHFSKPYVQGDKTVIQYGLSMITLELVSPFRARGQYHMKVYEKRKGSEFVLKGFPAF
jgi:hypothetical protein